FEDPPGTFADIKSGVTWNNFFVSGFSFFDRALSAFFSGNIFQSPYGTLVSEPYATTSESLVLAGDDPKKQDGYIVYYRLTADEANHTGLPRPPPAVIART